MENYYVVINKQQEGPYTIDELKELQISLSTLVWNETMETWQEAKSVPQIKDILKATPPPIPKVSDITYKVEAEIKAVKKNLVSSNNKTLLAKEIKIAYRLSIYSLLSIILFLPIFFQLDDGFKWVSFYCKTDCKAEQKHLLENLDWNSTDNYDYIKWQRKTGYAGQYARSSFISNQLKECRSNQDWRKNMIRYYFLEALKKTLISIPLFAILLIISRFFFKGIKWVNRTSKLSSKKK